MVTTKHPNPQWHFIEKYILKDHPQEHVHHVKLPHGTVIVYSGHTEIERIVPGGNPTNTR